MRAVFLAIAVLACLFAPSAEADGDPLICVETGEIGVLDIWSYDPPDPCFL